MKRAGVRTVCIGYESPIDEELKAMKEGYKALDTLKWTKVFRDYGFRIHAMLIFGYPLKEGVAVEVKEIVAAFKTFIRKAHFHTVQVLHPVPLVGTALRSRLEEEGKLFPLELVPWSKYDGNYACFKPDNMELRELQEIPMKLMDGFYNPWSLLSLILKTLAFPVDYLVRGWDRWYRGWYKDAVKYGGYRLIQRWQKRERKNEFLRRLEQYK